MVIIPTTSTLLRTHALERRDWSNVRFGSKADIEAGVSEVRFTPKSRHTAKCTVRLPGAYRNMAYGLWNCNSGTSIARLGHAGDDLMDGPRWTFGIASDLQRQDPPKRRAESARKVRLSDSGWRSAYEVENVG